MTVSRMKDRKRRIIFLARFHNYFIIPCVVLSVLAGKYFFLCMGLSFLLVAVWDFAGYKRRWKHMGCAYQLMSHGHKPVSPNNISWDSLRSGIIGANAVSLFTGTALLAAHFYFSSTGH